MNWTHDGLQADLASHLAGTRDRVIWEDMQLGPAGSPRPDVYTVPKSFTKFRPLAYEIKISVADFRRDVTAGKWQGYLEFASGVTFAVPAGMVTKADVPHGCGLMVRGDDGWRTLKAPTLRVIDTLSRNAWLKLLIDGIDRQHRIAAPRDVNPYSVQQKLRKKFGDSIAQLVTDAATAQDRAQDELRRAKDCHDLLLAHEKIRYAKEREQQKTDRIQVDAERALLCEVLGLDADSSAWEIAHRIKEVRRTLSADGEISRLTNIVDCVRRMVRDEA